MGTPGTSMAPATAAQADGKKPAPTRWGQKGISEKFIVLDSQLSETPNAQQIILADAGLLSELQHHHNGTYTITHNTGTNGKDNFGPYTAVNSYTLRAGTNTPLVQVSGRSLGILQIIEYPDRSMEANAAPASVEFPLTNSSDFFNFPSVTGVMRWWARVPVALKIAGAPGGFVAYMVLQNKRIANIIQPVFNLTGAASPYNAANEASANTGASAYFVTGNDTVTAAPTFETWKTLNTVPASRANMPLFGFTRYIYEVLQPYSGTSFTYNFEPGGELLRAVFQFLDGSAGSMATANLQNIAYQYGTNKQMDVYTPYRNINQQLIDYGRVLPQGCFIFDYYTPSRSLVNTKSTENTANVQVIAQFASTYVVPANSQVSVLLDKVFAVQNYLAK